MSSVSRGDRAVHFFSSLPHLRHDATTLCKRSNLPLPYIHPPPPTPITIIGLACRLSQYAATQPRPAPNPRETDFCNTVAQEGPFPSSSLRTHPDTSTNVLFTIIIYLRSSTTYSYRPRACRSACSYK
jgi:hypothetical protein